MFRVYGAKGYRFEFVKHNIFQPEACPLGFTDSTLL